MNRLVLLGEDVRTYFELLSGLIIGMTVLTGCQRPPSDQPQLAEVTGTVTFKGEPLANARIIFEPEEQGANSVDLTDSAGRYHLIYKPQKFGAAIGKHVVRIRPETGNFPPKYYAQPTLTAEVMPGDNTINFDLEP